MNYEKLVILKTLDEHDAGRDEAFKTVLDSGVDHTFFLDHPKYWTFINSHRKKYGKFPSLDTFAKHFKLKSVPEIKEPIEFYIDGLVKNKRRHLMLSVFSEAEDLFDQDHIDAGIVKVKSALKKIDSTFKGADLSIPGSVDERVANYEYRLNNPGVDGIPSGLTKLDEATFGWHPGELIVLHAYLGSYKSWTLLYMVYAAMQAGFKPMIATVEMGQLQIARRLDSILTSTEFDKLRAGSFQDKKDFAAFKNRMDAIKSMPECTIIGGVSFGELFLRAKLDEHTPDILFIDGIYLMQDDEGGKKAQWEQLNSISRNLKLIAEDYGIPVFATTQAWKPGRKQGSQGDESVDNVAFSGGMMQNADVGLSIGRIYDPVIEEFTNKLWIKLTKLREGEPVKFQAEIDFSAMQLKELQGIADLRTRGDADSSDKDDDVTEIEFEPPPVENTDAKINRGKEYYEDEIPF